MAAELKDEFESYVRKLTIAICKDIFLDKLEQLCSRYESIYNKYATAEEQITSAGASMQKKVQAADESIRNIEENLQTAFSTISDDIEEMEKSTDRLFKEIKVMDEKSRTDFIEELASYIEKYKREVAETFQEGYEQISGKLAGVITPKDLEQFLDSLEEHTRQTKEIASFINDTYKTEIEKNIRSIIAENKITQDELSKSVSLHVNEVMKKLEGAGQGAEASIIKKAQEFSDATDKQVAVFAKYLAKLLQYEKDSRDEALQQQIELIKKIGPDNDKIDQFQEKVNMLEQTVKELEKKNNNFNSRLKQSFNDYIKEQNALDQKRWQELQEQSTKKRKINLYWKIYMAATNIVILSCFAIIFFMQKPWEFFELRDIVLAGAAFLIIMVLQLTVIILLGNKK